VAVSEDEIREARRMVEELEGLSPCFSASTAMAGLIKQVRSKSFPVKDTVMVNLTGGERTGETAPKKITWMQRGPNGWVEDTGACRTDFTEAIPPHKVHPIRDTDSRVRKMVLNRNMVE
jgi:threonine synthase